MTQGKVNRWHQTLMNRIPLEREKIKRQTIQHRRLQHRKGAAYRNRTGTGEATRKLANL